MESKLPKVFAVAGITAILAALPYFVAAGEKRSAPAPAAQKKAPAFTPEERQKRRQQIKERLTKQVSELQKKKATGALNDEERQKLQRLEVLANRFGKQLPPVGAKGAANPSATAKPVKK